MITMIHPRPDEPIIAEFENTASLELHAYQNTFWIPKTGKPDLTSDSYLLSALNFVWPGRAHAGRINGVPG